MKKKYKAIIFDVDGTLILRHRDAIPTPKVTKTINNSSKLIHIGVATSRPLFMLSHIVDHLKLEGPSIISGGSQIINFPGRKFIWEKMIEKKDFLDIYAILNKIKIPFLIYDCINDKDVNFSKENIPEKSGHIVSFGMEEKIAHDIMKKISHISTVAAHKVPSWKSCKFDLMITHSLATKQHGIYELAKILNINTHEIIGVGDGYNDFPLLMACGLKVAMGNAVPELKAIADYIAPPVEKDGVVDIIEKFVLNA